MIEYLLNKTDYMKGMTLRMIKWIGKDITDRLCWTVKADSYEELYHKLIDLEIIDYQQVSPYALRQLEKAGQTVNDLNLSEDDSIEYIDNLPALCEEELRLLIYHCDDVAVYQEFIDKQYSAL